MLLKMEDETITNNSLTYINPKENEVETLRTAIEIACKHTNDPNVKTFLTQVLLENEANNNITLQNGSVMN